MIAESLDRKTFSGEESGEMREFANSNVALLAFRTASSDVFLLELYF